MAYEQRAIRRQKVRYDDDNSDTPLRWQRVIDGEKATPDAAPTITIYAPGNSTALVTDDDMTLSGTVATYSVDTTTEASWPVQTGYRARIKTTVGSIEYLDDVMFDVVKFILTLDIGVDQLAALDERVSSMQHRGDEDFGELIEAVRDELQAMIETRVIKDNRLLENMILDVSRVSIPARFLILHRIHEEKENYEAATRYMERFQELWRSTLSTIQYDSGQDLEEDSTLGGVQAFRLVY